jgi:peptide chain release factor
MLRPSLWRPFLRESVDSLHLVFRRPFASTFPPAGKQLPPRRVIPETDIIEYFLKGSGPGGQKINKTSSAVQLKHIPTGIVVKSQDTRSRSQNRKIARRLLAERVEEAELGDQSRTALKAALKSKKKASKVKKSKRKYRALDGGKESDGEAGWEEVEEDELRQATTEITLEEKGEHTVIDGRRKG